MSKKEAEQNTVNEEDPEYVREFFSGAIDTSAKLYSLLADEETSINKGFAVMALCSAMFLNEAILHIDDDIEQVQSDFFESVRMAYNLISKINEMGMESTLQ